MMNEYKTGSAPCLNSLMGKVGLKVRMEIKMEIKMRIGVEALGDLYLVKLCSLVRLLSDSIWFSAVKLYNPCVHMPV